MRHLHCALKWPPARLGGPWWWCIECTVLLGQFHAHFFMEILDIPANQGLQDWYQHGTWITTAHCAHGVRVELPEPDGFRSLVTDGWQDVWTSSFFALETHGKALVMRHQKENRSEIFAQNIIPFRRNTLWQQCSTALIFLSSGGVSDN